MIHTYNDTMARLGEMKSRYSQGFSLADRAFIDHLHMVLFGKIVTRTGCSDCYRDAYLIITSKLKRDGKMPTEANYKLKAGALLHFFGESEYYTLSVSDEVAERYLRINKNNIHKFQRYPEDWEARVAKAEEAAKTEEATKVEETEKVEEPVETEKVEETEKKTRKRRTRKAK